MKDFQRVTFDPMACKSQIAELGELLAQEAQLPEAAVLMPFFRARPQLTMGMAAFHYNIVTCDQLAYEYQLFGDFGADIVLGDSMRQTYCVVELEDGRTGNPFHSAPRFMPDWSSRFLHGFSQVVDWFWKLDDLSSTDDFGRRFGSRHADFVGVVVAGRSRDMDDREKARLAWWSRNVAISGQRVLCLTYDDLFHELGQRIETFKQS